MPELTPDQREFIGTSWKNKWDFILQTQNQLVNWIFAVHGGGIAGLLAFAAAKGSSFSIKVGLGAFALGLILIILYGVFMLYFEADKFKKFRRDIDALFSDQIDWSEFTRRGGGRPDRYKTCEILAWVSGVCGLVGIMTAVIAIL